MSEVSEKYILSASLLRKVFDKYFTEPPFQDGCESVCFSNDLPRELYSVCDKLEYAIIELEKQVKKLK